MIPARIRAFCFDAVGTLIIPNPPAHVVYAEVGRRHGSRYDAAAIRDRFATAFRAEEEADRASGWRTSEEREYRRWQTIVAQVLNDVADPERCLQELYTHFGRPEAWLYFEETIGSLRQLRERGYALAVASNYDHRLRTVLAGIEPFQLFDEIIISSEVGWRKPSPDFFKAICEIMNLAPEHIAFVGDDVQNDFEGAQAAGMLAILVDPHEAAKSIIPH